MMTKELQITVTEKAAQKIKEIIKNEGNDKLALRIFIAGGGCSGFKYGMALDENTYEDDIVITKDGAKIVIDQFSASFLNGSTIDYVENIMGSGFKIDNPNVVSTCGCGQSFSVGNRC
ncbi:MAG TPA: iron-sulfur cluster insertion protein ErpA [Candidatus Caldiarchaeum subterraneum]|uniref:Iron-sulfur cluster insertion protein ErpA n=1 Tax=Caldiarchaeum subterraneum TaxID=311458 RepID=A0A833EAK9_CALS0|nr:iron-sulfur cluster insertion protein ErpA [Aigarchaeota archaeon]HIQ29760.1 iron-sulfur cluster insertion protein ErpA [Candidatus Caldarchaeum subterraneum]